MDEDDEENEHKHSNEEDEENDVQEHFADWVCTDESE
jgi:hypothetical protein